MLTEQEQVEFGKSFDLWPEKGTIKAPTLAQIEGTLISSTFEEVNGRTKEGRSLKSGLEKGEVIQYCIWQYGPTESGMYAKGTGEFGASWMPCVVYFIEPDQFGFFTENIPLRSAPGRQINRKKVYKSGEDLQIWV